MRLLRGEFEERWSAGELAVSLVGMSNIGKSWLAGALAKLERRKMVVTDIAPQMGALESYLEKFAA